MLVSIITPCLNDGGFLRQALASSKYLGDLFLEHIVVDGYSIDPDTVEILEEARNNSRCRVIQAPPEGVYEAMNFGIEEASGEWIGIINADDFYHVGVGEALGDAVKRPRAGVVHGQVLRLHREDDTPFSCVGGNRGIRSKLGYGLPAAHSSMFVRAEVYKKIGMFSPRYRICGDFDFMLRAVDAGVQFQYVPLILAMMRDGGISNLPQNKSLLKEEKRQILALRKGFWPWLGRSWLGKSLRKRGLV